MTTWKLDSAHTQINFSAKHMMVTTVRGTFAEVEGTIELDETEPTRSKGEFRVGAASVDTKFAARDAHLRSADFFDAETYPEIHFISTAIRQTGDDAFEVTGDLTIKDVTKPIELAVEFLGVDQNAYGQTIIGFEASTSISRKDWGIDFNVPLEGGKLLVGDKVDIHLDVQAALQA